MYQKELISHKQENNRLKQKLKDLLSSQDSTIAYKPHSQAPTPGFNSEESEQRILHLKQSHQAELQRQADDLGEEISRAEKRLKDKCQQLDEAKNTVLDL